MVYTCIIHFLLVDICIFVHFTTGVMVAVVFVINLLKRHPNCRVLLHRKNTEEIELPSGEDPYDMTQQDPASSNALDSCLWELKVCSSVNSQSSMLYTLGAHVVLLLCHQLLVPHEQSLTSHFLPAVSELVKKVLTPETVLSDVELDLDKYLDNDHKQVTRHHTLCQFYIIMHACMHMWLLW